MVQITFYHMRNCFKSGQTKSFLMKFNFLGFGYGNYEPTFEMTNKQFSKIRRNKEYINLVCNGKIININQFKTH